MAIREIQEDELMNMVGMGQGNIVGIAKGKAAVLFYTPLCGTCKLAERMLEVVETTTVSVPIFKLNINYAPKLRDTWKISSIPCLVMIKDGRPLRFEYAMRSVGYIYELLRALD